MASNDLDDATYVVSMSAEERYCIGDTVRLRRSKLPHEPETPRGQIHNIIKSTIPSAEIHFELPTKDYPCQPNGLSLVPLIDIELAPKRFAGIMTKYSSKGYVRNWKERVFEVWSASITYREFNTVSILGGVTLTKKSELITDARIARKRDRFSGDPPHKFYCGIYEKRKTLWVSSSDQEVIEKFKVAVQEAINASVLLDSDEDEPPPNSICSVS